MRVHLDVLGWLYMLSGAVGIATGVALELLAAGTTAAVADIGVEPPGAPPVVWLFLMTGLLLIGGGGLMAVVGRKLVRRNRNGRPAALILAVPTLVIVPFGSVLAIYTFWVLLNDDARREFGRRLRSPLG